MTMRSLTHASRKLRSPARLWEPRAWAVVGHRSAGKTSLGEIVLHAGRVVRQPGEVGSKSTLLDWTAEATAHEQSRGIATAWIDVDDDTPLVWVDTPGTPALRHEQDRALHAADAALVVVDATQGIEQGTERVLEQIEVDRPCVVALTKIDRGLSVDETWALVDEVGKALDRRAVAVHLPWVEAGRLIGLIDLVEQQALRYDPGRSGAWSPEPIPAALRDEVWSAREALSEAVALTDDALLEQYLEDLELPWSIVEVGLERAVAEGTVVPVALTSAAFRVGGEPLLRVLARFHPPHRVARVRDHDGRDRPVDPEDGFVATVVASQWDKDGKPLHLLRVCGGSPGRRPLRNLRTGKAMKIGKWYRLRGPRRAVVQHPGVGAWVACFEDVDLRPGDTLAERVEVSVPLPDPPVAAWWVPDDEAPEGFAAALEAVVRTDPALASEHDGRGVRVSGTCGDHLQLAFERIEARLSGPVPAYLPPVPYRERPAKVVDDVVGTLRRTGEHGLVDAFGEVHLQVAPGDPDVAMCFTDACDDEEALPRRFRPAVRHGLEDALAEGPRGYPVVGVVVTLQHGEYDILCSTDEHLRQAGTLALRRGLELAGTELAEPVCTVSLEVPTEKTGDVLADLAAHRGRVQDLANDGETTCLEVESPYRELRTLPARLSGLTGGRGRLRWKLSHYRRVDMAEVVTGREPCRPSR